MKSGIHPEYVECEVICGCGEHFRTRATKPKIRVEICSKCHPYYTGKQRFVDSAGRVEKFIARWGAKIEQQKSQLAGREKKEAQ
jgi:large subunit ribosomal protein L31